MKSTSPIFWILALAVSGLLGYAYSAYLDLDQRIETLQTKVTSLELQSVRQTRMAIVTVAPKPQSTLRDQVYRSLQTINGVHTPLDGKKEKRILLNHTELTIKDPQAATDDAFFDLLGTLMDEDLVEQVRIPDVTKAEKSQRTFFRSVRQELIRFGVPNEIISTSPQTEIVVLLKKPL